MLSDSMVPPHILGAQWHEQTGPGVDAPPLVVKGTFLDFSFAGSGLRPRSKSDDGVYGLYAAHTAPHKKSDRWADSSDDEDETSTVSGSDQPTSPSLSCSSDVGDGLDVDHEALDATSATTAWFALPVFVPVMHVQPTSFAEALNARKCAMTNTVSQLASAALQAESTPKAAKPARTNRSARSGAGAKKNAQAAAKTTLMLRNVPLQCTRSMLLDVLNSQGFRSKFDFVYLPINFDTRLAFGYAFVNFVNEAVAEKAREQFQGFNSWPVPCGETCETSWSDPFQGLAANIDRYRNSPVMHESIPEEHKPVLFSGGRRKAFPAPTRFIKPPRGVRRSTPLEAVAKLSS
jgi:hypothetical protein